MMGLLIGDNKKILHDAQKLFVNHSTIMCDQDAEFHAGIHKYNKSTMFLESDIRRSEILEEIKCQNDMIK